MQRVGAGSHLSQGFSVLFEAPSQSHFSEARVAAAEQRCFDTPKQTDREVRRGWEGPAAGALLGRDGDYGGIKAFAHPTLFLPSAPCEPLKQEEFSSRNSSPEASLNSDTDLYTADQM